MFMFDRIRTTVRVARCKARKAQNRRIVLDLPEHIRADIGWPDLARTGLRTDHRKCH